MIALDTDTIAACIRTEACIDLDQRTAWLIAHAVANAAAIIAPCEFDSAAFFAACELAADDRVSP